MKKYLIRYTQDGDYIFTEKEKESFIIEADNYTLYENGAFIFTKEKEEGFVLMGHVRNVTITAVNE